MLSTGDKGKQGGAENDVTLAAAVLRVVFARGGKFKWSVTPFYRQFVCPREESRSKAGAVVARRI